MLRRAAALAAFLTLTACNSIPSQVTGTLKPQAESDPNAVTLAATVETSAFWMRAYDVSIRMNGEKVMKGHWQSSDIAGTFKGRRAWAKCLDKFSLASWIGYDIVCNVYVDSDFIGTVTATPE